jgi:hypothetical protein
VLGIPIGGHRVKAAFIVKQDINVVDTAKSTRPLLT